MRLTIEGLNSGGYYLTRNKLIFDYTKFICENSKYNDMKLEIDKKSALEIMHTLLDSENRLTKEMEELICDLEEIVENERSEKKKEINGI